MSPDVFAPAHRIAAQVREGDVTAVAVTEAFLARIAALDPVVNAFTDVTVERALAQARAVDNARATGAPLGPLAGVPFAAKNLFDIEGLPTRAGSKINRERQPAARDAVLVERLTAAGAVLLGGLNMGEYAYDFTGENAHDGPCRNPHDPARMAGGSSSGSGAATAAGFSPLSLGSDTNGSIRVPSSLCGVFGLKPSYGRLPRSRSFPFCDSLDHLGPFARDVTDLATAYDALQGPDAHDPACAQRPREPVLPSLQAGIGGLRIAVAGGHFATDDMPEAAAAVARVAQALGATQHVALEGAAIARAAAFLITNSESATFHLDRLRERADDFDPETRDRFLAGAMLPVAWYVQAQRARRWFHDEMMRVFADVDLIIAPATPCPAPLVGQKTLELRGESVPLRPNLGLFTQPISAIGLPVAAVPVFGAGLPIGVQIIAAPWREDLCLRAAFALQQEGVCEARAPVLG
ncbi:MAG TPA: AtzE family amidohydrolase [Bosea sp. (in: a-proteobacteria)]|uniref:AtzE family amidohydrolase n=1 Tax=Bosea sp. (in: a-proteobacteria) TaxID=1871050 RepID=UPI002DDD4E5E|nr:AtzE family amidohydrolase [Bosea sp. (in: a-proteobacteria)]HEV2554889.1 AtzE family amidohydrolase [Bosea sp. (in: a-proteobacteria)]